MNRFQLFRLLRRNNNLAFRRSPAYEQSVAAKVMMVIGAGFMAVYLIFFAVMFASIANGEAEPAMWLVFMPLLMLIDFGARFAVQQTPMMLLKPYLLQPLPSRSVIETFLLTSLLSGYNWTWLAFFLPYAFIVFCGGASLGVVLIIIVSGLLVVMINSQWYLLVRTLTQRSLLWWLLPLAVYSAYFVPLMTFADEDNSLFDEVMESFAAMGSHWWFVLLCLLVLVVFLMLNRWMQCRYAKDEIAQEQKKPAALKSVSRFAFLERFGLSGEYLKLELKSVMRCKTIRARVITSLALIAVLSLLIAYTDIYDGRMMLNFWCYYCFALYGMTTLVKVMCPEGNYIDLLLVHRENILSLLKAKYYFHAAVLLIPFVLMLPAVIAGKFSLMMMIAYMLITSGPLMMVLFQLAVYNKQTLPLDQKITGKNNVENGVQTIVVLASMLVPMALVAVFVLLFDELTAYWLLAATGLLFTLAHPLWLRNIYVRMMRRKYENLEGFHASR